MKKFITIICCLILASGSALAQNQKLELVVQTGHSGWKVYSGRFSPDGKTIASTSDDQTIKIWDASSGQELRTFSGKDFDTPKTAYSPDSKIIVGVSGISGTLKIWNVETGQELKSVQTGHNGYVYSIDFSPDGKTIATTGKDATIKLWDASTGQLLKTLTGHTKDVNWASFSPDGKTLVTTADDETIRLWNVETGQEIKLIPAQNRINSDHTSGSAFSKPSFSSDGKFFTAGGFRSVKIWSVETGQELNVPLPAERFYLFGRMNSLLSPDNQLIAIDGYEKKLKIFDARTRQIKDVDNPDNSRLLAFSPDGKKILLGNDSGTLRTIDVETQQTALTLARRFYYANQVSFSPDGNVLAVPEFAAKFIRLWDFRAGRKELRVLAGKDDRVDRIIFSPDSKLLISDSSQDVTWDRIIRIWDVESGNLLHSLPAVDSVPSEITFSPDGKTFAHACVKNYEPQITLWDSVSGKEISTFKTGQQNAVWSFRFSPDGKTIAAGSQDGTIKLFETATGQELKVFGKLYDGTPQSVIFSPDGKLLASGHSDKDNSIKIWDVKSGQELRKLVGHDDVPNVLAFSPDGKTLASGAYIRSLRRWQDKSIRLWNVQSGTQTQIFNRDDPSTVQKVLSAVPDFYLKSSTEPITPDKKLQAREAENGRLILTDVASNRELVSLVALGSEDWLTTAPNGLFDGTPTAWKQIIWRFDGNTFTYAPVEAFFKEFYRPGLLSEILSGKTPPAPSQDITQIDIRQPKIEISEIGGQTANLEKNPPIDKRIVTVKVEVTDNSDKARRENFPSSSGASDLRLFRNGSLVRLWEHDIFSLGEKDGCQQFPTQTNAPRKAVCQIDLPIIAGENEFTAYAFNHQNVKSNDANFEVTGADSLKREGTLYVLAVGVNEYAVSSHNLAFAVADVEAIGKEIEANQTKLLQKQFAKTEIIKLTDAQATKANILLALEKFALGDKLQLSSKLSPELETDFAKIKSTAPEDGLVIYYAGHGTASKNNFYLIPHDGFPAEKFADESRRLEKLYASSVSDEELQKVLQKIDAGKMLMIIDACNSGQALESEEKRRGPMNSKGLAQLAFEKGMYILTAAQSQQAALEVSKLGHGLLTFALLEGLKKADKSANGNITERKWLDYATAEVPQLQVTAMQTRNAENKKLPPAQKRSELAVATGDDTKLPPEKRGLQVPRIFYRRELETSPMIIAKP